MTVNLYKGLDKTTGGTGLSQLATYLQANRQLDQQQQQFDRQQKLNEDKFKAERDDVQFSRHKEKLQSDLARINLAAGENGFANAEDFLKSEKGFQFAMRDGTFSRAMMPELYSRPEVDPEAEPEFIDLGNGKYGVKVRRKDGGDGVITQDGTSNPDSLVMEFDPSQMYQGYMSTLGEYGITDLGRAMGATYQNENNNDVVSTISLDGATASSSQPVQVTEQPTSAVAPVPNVQSPQPTAPAVGRGQNERPVDAPEPEGNAGHYRPGGGGAVPNVIQQRTKMLAHRISRGQASEKDIAEFKSNLERNAGIVESDELIASTAKGLGMTPRPEAGVESTQAENPLLEQVKNDLIEKGIVGNLGEASKQAAAFLNYNVGGAILSTGGALKDIFFGKGSTEGKTEAQVTTEVGVTPLHIPVDGTGKEFLEGVQKINIGAGKEGVPQTVSTKVITNPTMTLRITGPKSKYTNQQKAMMLASALSVGAKDPALVAAQVRETMHDVMNQGGTTDAKINLLRDMLNNQEQLKIAKVKALTGKNDAAVKQYEANEEAYQELTNAIAIQHVPDLQRWAKANYGEDQVVSAENAGEYYRMWEQASAAQNSAFLRKLGVPFQNGYLSRGDMHASQAILLSDLLRSGLNQHGREDTRWFSSEVTDRFMSMDSTALKGAWSKLPEVMESNPDLYTQIQQMDAPQRLNAMYSILNQIADGGS